MHHSTDCKTACLTSIWMHAGEMLGRPQPDSHLYRINGIWPGVAICNVGGMEIVLLMACTSELFKDLLKLHTHMQSFRAVVKVNIPKASIASSESGNIPGQFQ